MDTKTSHGDGLLPYLDRLHTTALGVERIKRNVGRDLDDVVMWCREKIEEPDSVIFRKGKNWYIDAGSYEITVNAYSFTIITVHRRRQP